MLPKYRFNRALVFVALFLGFSSQAFSLDVPKRPDGYVTDQAGILSLEKKSQIESYLADYENQTTHQVVVAIFKSLEGASLEDFSIRLAESWKVGTKAKDNGVILIIFVQDRKVRIEVGYGLEGALPDALAGQIIQENIVPYFRRGEYDKGVLAGLEGILTAIRGEYQEPGSKEQVNYQRPLTPAEIQILKNQAKTFMKFALALVVLFFVIDCFRYKGYLVDHRIYKERYTFWEWWFRFAILLFILNAIFRMLFYATLRSRGGVYGSRSGFGGFSGGGGSFGGGGASGGW